MNSPQLQLKYKDVSQVAAIMIESLLIFISTDLIRYVPRSLIAVCTEGKSRGLKDPCVRVLSDQELNQDGAIAANQTTVTQAATGIIMLWSRTLWRDDCTIRRCRCVQVCVIALQACSS